MDALLWLFGIGGRGRPATGPLSTMVGESGPRSRVWSTRVGESEGSLPPRGISTSVGESEGSLGGGLIGGGDPGGKMEPEEELPPWEGVRTAAPPSPGSEGVPSGRPRENCSIKRPLPVTGQRKPFRRCLACVRAQHAERRG